MPTPSPTVDELVATIQRSSLPTVVVEGSDDVIIYRWMEAVLKNSSIDFLPCHARSVVLSLFERRAEFASKQVVFVADQDMWVFSAPPSKYNDVLFTTGYSIENDVLSSRAADKLFDPDEKTAFALIMLALEEWFSFEVSKDAAGEVCVLNVSLRNIVELSTYKLSASFLASRGYVAVTGPTRERVRSDPLMCIRGKNLLDVYSHLLNGPTRASRYSKKAILEMCVKLPDNHPLCDRLIQTIRERFGVV